MLQPDMTEHQEPEVSLPPRRPLRPLDQFQGTLAQRVHASLREAILSMSLRPGDILRKPEICEALGVSRSPVSEAVARLAVEHLVRIVPQAGTYVARFSLEEVREGAFLREALELAAVEKVASEITDDQVVLLRRNLRLQEALVEDLDVACEPGAPVAASGTRSGGRDAVRAPPDHRRHRSP